MQPFINWGPVAVIVGGYLLGIYFQNKRLDDLKTELLRFLDAKFEAVDAKFESVDERFKALDEKMDLKFKAVDERFKALDAKIDQNFEIQRQMLLRVEGILDVRVKHLEEKER